MNTDLIERLDQLAHQQADGTDFHKDRRLTAEDTVYWQAKKALTQADARIARLEEAATFARQVLADERESLRGSYVNLIGPNKGKVTDPDGKRWIAPFTKAIRLIDTALKGDI
jgi:multidrug efflux pump subunit AcrA (membrane-fusion protein)